MANISIGQNIQSLKVMRSLNDAINSGIDAQERLSSGLRINRASDDAAGLSISSQLNSSARVFTQAIRNISDGISYLNIADGALAALTDVIIRGQELAEQSANGSYSNVQRNALENELDALSAEYSRVLEGTTFNGRRILVGSDSAEELRIQAGYGIEGSIGITISADPLSSSSATTSWDGTFTSEQTFTFPANRFGFTAGDYNEDGITDTVVNGRSGTGFAHVNLGNADGTYAAPISLAFGGASASGWWEMTTDIDLDGNSDIVISNQGAGELSFSIFLGNGDGTFQNQITTSGTAPFYMTAGDFDDDNLVDLVTVEGNGRTRLFIGNGDGTFEAPSTVFTSSVSTSWTVQSGDLNGDDDLDFIRIRGSRFVDVLLGNGDGTFAAPVSYVTGHSINTDGASATLGDMNNDGILDIVAASNVEGLVVVLGNSDGTFGDAIGSFAPGERLVSLGDINNDGFLDVASGNLISLGNGDGTLQAPTTTFIVGLGMVYPIFANINQDEVLDLVGNNRSNTFYSIISETSEITSSSGGALSISTVESARETLTALSEQLTTISNERGRIGAFQSRLNVALATLQSSVLNIKAAEGRITDTDIAAESANLVSSKILSEAAASVLAQANQAPALAIQLLR